jgi:hypothetical protein
MQELIQNIAAKAGISEEQAAAAVQATKDYIKAKVPIAAPMIDQFFGGSFDPSTAMKAASADWMDKAKDRAQDAGEKIQDFTHDAIGKSADFAKEANKQMHDWAEKTGGWSEDAMNKVKEMFGGKKDENNPKP